MDFVQWVAVVSFGLGILGSYLEVLKDNSNTRLIATALSMSMGVTVYGRVFGWW